MMLPSLDAAVVTAFVLVAAEAVPSLNMEPHCRFASSSTPDPANDFKTCMEDEARARDQVIAEWAQFLTSEREYCLRESLVGPDPTYTELLTCLEVAREVRFLQEKEKSTGSPQTPNKE